MITISLCMIVKDEEDTLHRCLNCVKDFVDEIIIVDTGSTDKTKEIAYEFTNKVYDFEWCDDFAKARNYSFSKATKEYIMWLDADDIILNKDLDKLKKLKTDMDKKIDLVMLKYDLNLDENGVPALSFYRERLFKREKGYTWIGRIHEVIPIEGVVKKEEISITHSKVHQTKKGRNLNIFKKMLQENEKFDARQTFYFARELYYNKEYNEAITKFEEFLNMEEGFIENKISACLDLYNLYIEIGNKREAMRSILRSFLYDCPRGEASCILGSYFLEKKEYKKALFWYEQALSCKVDMNNGGFYIKDAYDFIPYINICVCYYYLNCIEKARLFNEKAGKIKPNSKEYKKNKIVLEKIKI